MPVRRFRDYPNTRVYTTARVVIHEGIMYCNPEYGGCSGMIRDLRQAIGRVAFKTFDWSQPLTLTAGGGQLTIRSPDWNVFFYMDAQDAPIIPMAPEAGD